MLDMSVNLLRDGIVAGRRSTNHALVRISAPDLPEDHDRTIRPILNLSLVIDASGSMRGAPLEEAKRCAAMIVDGLDPRDMVSIVAYGSEAQTFWPATSAADKIAIKAAIARIGINGITALHAGWETGAKLTLEAHNKLLAEDPTSPPISRVILLSDGKANVGERRLSVLSDILADMAAQGVSTSTFGLGLRFNEEFMQGLAIRGTGHG